MKGGKNISKLFKLYKSDPDIYKSGRYMYLAKSASYLYIKGDILYFKCFWHICIVTNHPGMSGTLSNFLPLFRKGPGWPSSGPLSRNSNVHLFSHIPNAGPLPIMRSNIHLRMRSWKGWCPRAHKCSTNVCMIAGTAAASYSSMAEIQLRQPLLWRWTPFKTTREV